VPLGGKEGRIALDQSRTVDRDRLRKRLGVLPPATLSSIFAVLAELFEFS
jgi:mRNA-degrading endonuclease toxin of MazEF toxin-antitoxin module